MGRFIASTASKMNQSPQPQHQGVPVALRDPRQLLSLEDLELEETQHEHGEDEEDRGEGHRQAAFDEALGARPETRPGAVLSPDHDSALGARRSGLWPSSSPR